MALKRITLGIAGALLAASSLCMPALAQDHVGGTLRMVASSAGGTIDPQVNYVQEFAQIFAVTNDGLVTYAKVGGPQSMQVVPDLAVAMPQVLDNGTTYVFQLRRGIKFSTGQEVTPADVLASFQRLFKVESPNAGAWYSVIVGGSACITNPSHCTLAGGLVVDDKTYSITFHLTHPDPDFLYQLAMPFAVILPANTPAENLGTIPSAATGPYMIVSYDPQKELVLKRNPYFKPWSALAQPAGYVDEAVEKFGVSPEDGVTEIENGQADWMFDSPPTDRLAEVGTKYISQVHINPIIGLWYAAMNVNIPPFNNVDVRRAVNYAFNREAGVNIWGGPRLAKPTCQSLPPGVAGYEPYCPYTKNPGAVWSAPDMEKAEALMKASGEKPGQKVVVITDDQMADPSLGTYLVSVLNQLGFHATLKVISGDIQFPYIQNSKNKTQIAVTSWLSDYPTASDFINVLLSCGSFHPGSDSSPNISGFCQKGINDQINQALMLEVSDPAAATKLWAQIDKEVTDQAPWVPMFTPDQLSFVSKRLGNFSYSYLDRMLISKAWVQ